MKIRKDGLYKGQSGPVRRAVSVGKAVVEYADAKGVGVMPINQFRAWVVRECKYAPMEIVEA